MQCWAVHAGLLLILALAQTAVAGPASLALSAPRADGKLLIFRASRSATSQLAQLQAFVYAHGKLGDTVWSNGQGHSSSDTTTIYSLAVDGAGVLCTRRHGPLLSQPEVVQEPMPDASRAGADNLLEWLELRQSARQYAATTVASTAPALVYAGDRNVGYGRLPAPAGSSYADFLHRQAGRPDVLLMFVGNNLLHVYNAHSGVRLFSYLPRQLYRLFASQAGSPRAQLPGALPQLRPITGAAPAAGPAYFNGHWRRVIVAPVGPGGRGAVALDVSNASAFRASDILWQIGPRHLAVAAGVHPALPASAYLGAVAAAPAIVRLDSGDWVALLGNGYQSPTGRAALLVLDLATGKLIGLLDTGAGGHNGLGPVAAIDSDGDLSVDTVYAGDLKGNLWKFDLSGSRREQWQVAAAGQPVFTATTKQGERQSITIRPNVMAHPRGGIMVVFATGCGRSRLGRGCAGRQSIYGIWDKPGHVEKAALPVAGSTLVRQQFTGSSVADGHAVRWLSERPVDYAQHNGWVLDLALDGVAVANGIHIVAGMAVMLVTSAADNVLTPSHGASLLVINPLTGTQFAQPMLDLNVDGEWDVGDSVASPERAGAGLSVYPGVAALGAGHASDVLVIPRPDRGQNVVVGGLVAPGVVMRVRGWQRDERIFWQWVH